MDCQRIAHACAQHGWGRRCQKATKVATLLLVFLITVIALAHSVAAVAQAAEQPTSQVLEQSRRYQLQFRAGDMAVLPPWVALLEQATQAQPENADLWYWLGYVYLAQGAQALLAGKPAEAMPAMQKGPAALRQALKINPNHAEALSQLGGLQTMLGPVLQLPAMAPRGVAQMNRAVQLAPGSLRVRLMRAFAGANLPPGLRNQAAEAEDLDYLIGVAEWGTAGDYLRIMRADLDFETGKPQLARAMYRTVEGAGSGASTEARARLAALDAGGISMTDIKALRAAAGAQCALCHGR
jgi:tetratricopeptide (TPR) repeat protein